MLHGSNQIFLLRSRHSTQIFCAPPSHLHLSYFNKSATASLLEDASLAVTAALKSLAFGQPQGEEGCAQGTRQPRSHHSRPHYTQIFKPPNPDLPFLFFFYFPFQVTATSMVGRFLLPPTLSWPHADSDTDAHPNASLFRFPLSFPSFVSLFLRITGSPLMFGTFAIPVESCFASSLCVPFALTSKNLAYHSALETLDGVVSKEQMDNWHDIARSINP
jgi:hypothetical protein